ncbi:hypothetical protein [uncultured Sulfitobacter sp.]|uniref:hypothetical protein n=1 Tax=uncultured Sulfitobacter sp. TaxID=191468 RepID=UPI00260CE3E7|nr:hypothetical protein [uncultured Sulfitobacter sp.]
MAYLMTAIMTGGVSALLSAFNGGTLGDIFWNYVVFGHMGMATLALAIVTASLLDRRSKGEPSAG